MAARRFNARPSTDYSTASPFDFDYSDPGGRELKFYLCDVFADLPPGQLNAGDQAYVISNNTFWIAINTTTWGLMGPSSGTALTVQEEDGAPIDAATTILRFPNGSLTSNGTGDLSVSFGSGGHLIRENGVLQTTRGAINFVDVDAGAGLLTDDAIDDEVEVNLSLYVLEAATPGGELGGTYATPTVDALHSGSTHAATQAAAEATAAAALAGHTGDTVDAHDASAVSVDSTTLSGVGLDVQAVLEELDNSIDNHLADALDAHDASAVSVVDAGGYFAGIDVEAVLQELGAQAPAHTIHDQDSAALTQRSALRAQGKGHMAVDNSTDSATDIVSGLYYDAIVDNTDHHGADRSRTISVTSITRSGSTATVTTPAAHGFITGQAVTIAGANESEYNGVFVITSHATSTTFTYTLTGTPSTPATGTITAKVYAAIYSTLQAAITDKKVSIFVHSAGDVTDISISATDSVQRILGEATLLSAIPVNITSAKVGCSFEFLNFTSKRLKWTGERQLALGCFFSGTITPGTGLTNNVPGTAVNIVSSTNATPIVVTATAHGFSTGDYVVIASHTVNTNANGAWRIINTGANTFTLIGSIGNGVGGATGTAREEGVNATILSIPWDGGANGGLPSGGYAAMDNEYIGYSSGGGASSGTLVIGHVNRRGQWESAPLSEGFAHPDNSVLTDITDGHLIVEANDCTILTCQFISCIGPYTNCIIQRTGKFRMRVVSSVFLGNTTWACIQQLPANNSGDVFGNNTISACVFDTNTCWEAIIDAAEPNSGTNTHLGFARGVSINGCLFRDYNNCAIKNHGTIWNISGNVFDETTSMTRTILVNRVGGISADQNSFPIDGGALLVGAADKGLALIDSEIISYHKIGGTSMTQVGRGLMGTTAATHADDAVITFLGQIGVMTVGGGAGANAAPVLIAGCLFQTSKIPALSYDTRGSGPATTIETSGCNGGTVYMGTNWAAIANTGSLDFDCRSKSGTRIMSHGGVPVILNPSTTTDLWTPRITAGAFATGYQIPANRFIALGRISGDLSAISEPWINRTAATSVVGNIVIIDVGNANSVVNAPVAAGSILVAGVVLNAVANLADVQLATIGVVTVNCDTAAVAIGDFLGTSAITAGLATPVAVPLFNTYFARARTAKAAGANGAVTASMRLQ